MSFDEDLRRRSPLTLHDYMAAANAHYYATRDPLGAAGDFTTAPEISQMFGELIGVWLADLWARAGRPPAAYVELGPGRGTLAADALRAAAKLGLSPPVHFVETSPALRAAQARLHPAATWHDDISTLPTDRPLLLVANEFFDALPIRQFVRTREGWRERAVEWRDGRWTWTTLPTSTVTPDLIRGLPSFAASEGQVSDILEINPAAQAITATLAARLAAQGGAALMIDYGHTQPALGDTLQAVRAHAPVDPLSNPGEADLTAHVDFSALAAAAKGATVHGTVPQGTFLRAMGIGLRTAALTARAPDRADAIAAQRDRLISPDAMGLLFKAVALTAPTWPAPAGFG